MKWESFVTAAYQERRTRENATFDLYDFQVRVPVGPVRVSIGKMKALFSYELVVLSVLLPRQKRGRRFEKVAESGSRMSSEVQAARIACTYDSFGDDREELRLFLVD